MRPRAGTLRHRITFLTADTVQRASGQVSHTGWTEGITVSARVSPLSGRKLEIARSHHNTVTHEVEIRWREDMDEYDYIRVGDTRYLEINGPAINRDLMNETLVFNCTEVSAGLLPDD